MFCVVGGKLLIAGPNLPYSHATWFERLGWGAKKHESFMRTGLRGIIDKKGDIYFYTGYNFRVNRRIEKEFFELFAELVKKMKIKRTAQIFGGLIKQKEAGRIWPRRKYFGSANIWLND